MTAGSKVILQLPLVRVRETIEEDEGISIIECSVTSPQSQDIIKRLRFCAADWNAIIAQLTVALDVIKLHPNVVATREGGAIDRAMQDIGAENAATPRVSLEAPQHRRGLVTRKL